MLVAFPIGNLVLVPIFDIAHLVTHDAVFAHVSFWLLTCGIAGGLLAAVPGFIDWLGVPQQSRAYRVGIRHMVAVVSAVVLYLISWIVRMTGGIIEAGAGSLVLVLFGLVPLAIGGWLGGELRERHGLGISPDAGYDASPSLGARPRVPFGTRPPEPRPA
jgi:uncharacterized membrane protein